MRKSLMTTIGIGTEADFFARGRKIARLADAGEPLPFERTVTMEEFSELAQFMSPGRLALIQQVREHEGTITELANRLGRHRNHVSKDVAALEDKGFFIVKDEVLPGHGRAKLVSMPKGKMRIVATI
jgi:predicted transcriptional regulator